MILQLMPCDRQSGLRRDDPCQQLLQDTAGIAAVWRDNFLQRREYPCVTFTHYHLNVGGTKADPYRMVFLQTIHLSPRMHLLFMIG